MLHMLLVTLHYLYGLWQVITNQDKCPTNNFNTKLSSKIKKVILPATETRNILGN